MSQSHLMIDFPIRGPANAKALPGDLPPLMPDLATAQDDLGTVHFSRFMVVGDEKLLFLFGDMEKYFQDFADKTAFVFNALFPRVVGGPPTPVENNAQAFYQWGLENNRGGHRPPGVPRRRAQARHRRG